MLGQVHQFSLWLHYVGPPSSTSRPTPADASGFAAGSPPDEAEMVQATGSGEVVAKNGPSGEGREGGGGPATLGRRPVVAGMERGVEEGGVGRIKRPNALQSCQPNT